MRKRVFQAILIGIFILSLPPVVMAACSFDTSGSCGTDTNKWCYNDNCISCSSGFANCDLKEGCECNLDAEKVCRSGACIAVSSGGVVDCPAGQICNPLKYDTFEGLINAIVDFIFWMGITIAPVMLIISGVMFVTAGGSLERTTTAKKMILYTLIGLAVTLLAKGLILVLKSILGVKEAVFLLLTCFT